MDEAVRYAIHFEVIERVPEPEIRQTWSVMLAEFIYGDVNNIPRNTRKKMGIDLD